MNNGATNLHNEERAVTSDDALYITDNYWVVVFELRDPRFTYEVWRAQYGVVNNTTGVIEHEALSFPAAVQWADMLQEATDKIERESDDYDKFLQEMSALDDDETTSH